MSSTGIQYTIEALSHDSAMDAHHTSFPGTYIFRRLPMVFLFCSAEGSRPTALDPKTALPARISS